MALCGVLHLQPKRKLISFFSPFWCVCPFFLLPSLRQWLCLLFRLLWPSFRASCALYVHCDKTWHSWHCTSPQAWRICSLHYPESYIWRRYKSKWQLFLFSKTCTTSLQHIPVNLLGSNCSSYVPLAEIGSSYHHKLLAQGRDSRVCSWTAWGRGLA